MGIQIRLNEKNYIVVKSIDGKLFPQSGVFSILDNAKKRCLKIKEEYYAGLQDARHAQWVRDHNVQEPYLAEISVKEYFEEEANNEQANDEMRTRG